MIDFMKIFILLDLLLGMLKDTLENWRYWNLTFSAGEWMAVKKLLSTGDSESVVPPDLALIDLDQIRFQAKDTTPFYKKIDDVRVTAKPSLINTAVGWVFGGDDYVDLGIKESLAFLDSDPWSFSHWMNWAGQDDKENVFYAGNLQLGEQQFLLRRSNNNRFGFRDRLGTYQIFAEDSSTPYIGYWTYLTWVADGSGNLSLYINKELFGTLTSVPTTVRFSGLGKAYTDDTYNFKGYIALPSVANKAWSQQQVENFYPATKGLFSPRG